ncbi:MAG: nucleotidyltransferase [candidate division Zixibacteria bacterium]
MEPALVATWEDTFTSWAQGPGKTEEQRCENAIKAIRDAINKSDQLNHRDINVFVQGSYRNRVNVRLDSDVDVAVLCHNTFYYDLPEGATAEGYGIEPSKYDYSVFKNELQAALTSHFGSAAVTRCNKAFDIKENSYRVEADVAPFFDYREYSGINRFRAGVKLISDSSEVIKNWPEQHYENGVSKNDATNRRFKRLVRIFKRLAINMSDTGESATKDLPGFFIECLVFNVPNDDFGRSSYTDDVRNVIVHIYQNTKEDDSCKGWTEVNGIKYLFHSTQKWTRQQANAFALAAWQYVGFTS